MNTMRRINNTGFPSPRPTPKFFQLCGAIVLAVCAIAVIDEAFFSRPEIDGVLDDSLESSHRSNELFWLGTDPQYARDEDVGFPDPTRHLNEKGRKKARAKMVKLRKKAAEANKVRRAKQGAPHVVGTAANMTLTTPKKPIMYTFFEKVGEGGCCGMTKEGHENLLASWRKAWEDKGWETRILTKNHAQKHESFEELEEKLIKLGIDEYNRRCYWRWLAMVTVHGGWMSDYDTFPLELTAELANKIAEVRTFKSFGLHVPCLVHAPAAEWDRIIHLMMDLLPDEYEDGIITDMYSLKEAGEIPDNGMLWSSVVAPKFYYERDDKGELIMDCNKMKRKLALHFSHYAVELSVENNIFPVEGVTDKEGAVMKRAEAALLIMEDFKKQCA